MQQQRGGKNNQTEKQRRKEKPAQRKQTLAGKRARLGFLLVNLLLILVERHAKPGTKSKGV
jgi:hypothetical protein